MEPVSAERAVALLSAALGREHTLVGSLAGGETGATEIVDAAGHRSVLKWEVHPGNAEARRIGARLAERLRVEAAWPSPAQRVIETDECLLVVQDLLPGEPVTRVDDAMVDALLDLHERRLQLAPEPDDGTWAADMIELLVDGGDGWCLHEPLRTFDARTRRIVERIEEIGRSLRADDLPGGDVVHGDLHYGNLLQVGGRLSAVIDMDYTRVGDADFDLLTLALASLEVEVDGRARPRLFDVGIDALPEPKRSAYVANIVLRCLDWPIRKGGRTDEIELWVQEADRLLPS